jgi:DNA-binding CsgD family transcriptional regulator
LRKAAEAIGRLSDLERAIPYYERAIDALVECGDLALAVRTGTNFAGALFNANRVEQAQRVVERTLELARDSNDVQLVHAVLVRMASLRMAMRETAAAWAHLEAVDESSLDPASVTTVEYHLMKSGLHAQRGEAERWAERYPLALEALRRGSHHAMVERYARMTVAIDALALGETAQAREHAEAALATARRIRSGEAHTLTLLVEIERRSGNLRKALDHLRSIVPVEEYLVRKSRAIVALKLALDLGDDDLLRANLDLGLLDGAGSFDFASAMTLAPFAVATARLGRLDEARELAERAAASMTTAYESPWEVANVALLLPHRADALRRTVAAEAGPPAGRVNAALDALLRGVAARAAGDLATASEAGREAAGGFAAIGWPILEAQSLEAAGDRAAALAIYLRVGCSADARRLERDASEGHGVAPLSPRERQVARLVATGKNNREVARELSLSVKAIERYLTSAYQKLGIRSRSQLAAFIAAGERPGSWE